jgi:FkbM family methyltransferase
VELDAGRFLRRHPILRQLFSWPRALRRTLLISRESRVNEVMERLSTLVESDISICVEEFDGVFNISPKSDLFRRIIQFGNYEPVLSELFRSNVKPDLDIIDIGANVGFYTVGGAKLLSKGRVLAVEPAPAAFARLQENVLKNKVEHRVLLFNGLISSRTGYENLQTITGREEYSSIGSMSHPSIGSSAYQSVTVQAMKLDDLVIRHQLRPALLKIDVEGAEPQVFAGARDTLERYRPVVLCEVSNQLLHPNGADGRDIVKVFEELNYIVVDPNDPKAVPGTASFGEIFCRPRDI